MSQEDKQLLDGFIQEALTLLDEAKDEIGEGECGPDGVNAVFRCLHTLKGTSSFLDLLDFSAYVHKVEDFVRDKQEAKDGLTSEELEVLHSNLDLMVEAVHSADDPSILEQPVYHESLQELYALQAKEGSLENFVGMLVEMKEMISTNDCEMTADSLCPVMDEIKLLKKKIIAKKSRQVLPVDYRLLEKVELAGKDVTEMVRLQLTVLEELKVNGPGELFAKYDIVTLFADLEIFQADLTEGENLLTWETVFDVYATMPEVVEQNFDRFWVNGIAKDAEITWFEKESPKEEGNKVVEDKDAVGKKAKPAQEKEEFFRVSGRVMQEVARNVGALVANRNSMENLIQEMGKYVPVTYRKHLKDSYTDLDENVNKLEGHVSSLNNRLLKDVIGRLPAVVAKLSGELGKEINVELTGEDIEIPRSLVKSLNDPLVHIVRNSVDHGIGTPEERQENGKSGRGKLSIMATRVDDLLNISVMDDGKGLDVEKIREKAIGKGVITAEDDLDEKALQQLVFAPGFSTNEEVTSVSGRGVGMDVVRTAIEAAGGRVQLSSVPGEGTVLEIILPLDMGNQTRDVQLIEMGDQVYGIEYRSLVEVMNIEDVAMSSFRGNDFFDYRGNLLPFINMAEFLKYQGDHQDAVRIVIVEDEQQRRLACGVHGIKYKVKVVVSQFDHEFLKNNQTFIGTAVVGTGKPILVLNFRDINDYV